MIKVSSGKSRRRISVADSVYFVVLFGTAAASAGLPFYIHFNPEKFSPPQMQFSGALERRLSESVGRTEYDRRVSALVKPKLLLDQITTGAVPEVRAAKALTAAQPFPEGLPDKGHQIELIYVGRNRALIAADGKIELASVGTRLPDGSAVSSISSQNGVWEVATTRGAILKWQPSN